MKSANLKRLIAFANKLDDIGLHAEAEDIDQAARDYSSKTMPDPKYQHVFQAISEALGASSLPQELRDEVWMIIQGVQYSPGFMTPVDREYYIPEETAPLFVNQSTINMALGYAEYYKSLMEIEREMEEASAAGDEERYQGLQREYDQDKAGLESRWKDLMELKKTNTRDFDKAREYIEYALNRVRGGDDGQPEIRLYEDRRGGDQRRKG